MSHDSAELHALELAMTQVNRIVLGKPHEVRLSFACLLAGGHLLLEDVPGVGKTTLAHAIAASSGLSYQRIQFTSDLLPSDILGVSIFERDSSRFQFHPGPIFAQLILADEINRATPKTQSALLEAMAELQVTGDGETRPLPKPFFVIATQNPIDMAGTFPLPDSQLDRFLLRLSIGYPDAAAERDMLISTDRRALLDGLKPILNTESLLQLRQQVQAMPVSSALVDYVQRLLSASRNHAGVRVGLSPRAGLALLAAARAVAFLARRPFVLPEDIQSVFVAVAAHRLVPGGDRERSRDDLAQQILRDTAVD